MDILIVLLILGAAAAALEIAYSRLQAAVENEEARLAADKAAEEKEQKDEAASNRCLFLCGIRGQFV